MSNLLDNETFLRAVDATPLVSIDLIVQNHDNLVLTGFRKNKPAQGYWFTPGGRIRKNEKIRDAFERLAKTELGIEIAFEDAQPLGNFEHFYKDNTFAKKGISTHYVVLAFAVSVKEGQQINLDDQHTEHQWMTVDDLLNAADVHDYTKDYFR